MRILSFYIKGKMAHFRRFYANSSSLTYTIPPRTTICGILAGLIGLPRDSYYEQFSCSNCGIAVAARSRTKKLVQTMNLLKVEQINELNGSSGVHTQTATEVLMPYNIREQDICYQIWISHMDNDVMQKLTYYLLSYQPCYISKGITLALGTAYNTGWIEYVGEFKGKKIDSGNISARIISVIPQKSVKEIGIKNMFDTEYRLIREEIPIEFDKERRLNPEGLSNMIFDLNGNPLPVIVDECIQLDNGDTIVWME